MQEMHGNELCRRQMMAAIESGLTGIFFVTGPWGLGKRTFLRETLDPEGVGLIVESSIDGVRSVLDRSFSSSVLDGCHDLAILDCDRMSVPAQDACLKLLEEPPPGCRIWVHATDQSGIGRALLSRKRVEFRWFPLSSDEMEAFASTLGEVDRFSLEVSAGRPGCYALMRPDPRFQMLHESVRRAMSGSNLLIEPLPAILSELDGDTPFRETVFMTLCHAAKSDPVRGIPILKLASKVLTSALNVELHWFTAMSALRGR